MIYDPRAVCPQFDAFLERALPDLKVRTFLLDLVAYSLYGKTWLKILPLLMGPKDTSKSTLMEVLRYLWRLCRDDRLQSSRTDTRRIRREYSRLGKVAESVLL